jgi:membrane-associated PAP2 superfamily phosphatase
MATIVTNVVAVARRPAVWIPAVVLAAATVVFWYTKLDLVVVGRFFSGDFAVPEGARWPLKAAQPWITLYDWGQLPAWILGIGGLVVWIVSFFWKKLERWRDPGLFYVLLLMIGPGILVNWVFKPYWNRPRPRATAPFGGQREFLPVWQRGLSDGESFPSGHAATGFYLMAPAFVYYRRRPWLAAAFLLLGLTGGSVIGLARIVAGDHFPSDILWSGGIVYYSALVLAAPFHFGREKSGAAQTIEA